jgi:hypothetical protein
MNYARPLEADNMLFSLFTCMEPFPTNAVELPVWGESKYLGGVYASLILKISLLDG